MAEPKTECRTPAEGRDGVTRIPTWKYDLLHDAILEAVAEAGPEGLRFSELKDVIRPKLTADDLAKLGSLGWHVTSVKLNMEVTGEITRLAGKGPQRIILKS